MTASETNDTPPAPANIALVGFMGVGKTTVGRLLAERLGFALRDTDGEIARESGCDVPTLFARDGEAAFRDREAATLARACAGAGQVIATGGGIVLRADNRELLTRTSWVVWLTARPDVVALRVGASAKNGGRPVLALDDGETLGTRILRLLGERGPLYQQVANAIVDTSDRAPASVVAEIVRKWEKAGGRTR